MDSSSRHEEPNQQEPSRLRETDDLRRTTYIYDASGRIVASISSGPSGYAGHQTVPGSAQSAAATDPPGEAAPASSVEHDREKRLFRVTDPDGKVTEFHDRAQRFLIVAPDPQTGKLEPVISWGVPKVMYLCREAGL